MRSVGLLRPDLSLAAHSGFLPSDGISPIYNFFDRTGGGLEWRAAVTRRRQRDWRGGRLSYDEHNGTDFVCPPGTPVVAAAPGIVVATRDRWLRGGLTACVDHGSGIVTQYTHLTSVVADLGQKVQRGETIALSGVSGFDIMQFFPWVPPHLHFMVWIDGVPVDPYCADGEAERAGTWVTRNSPEAAPGPLGGDVIPAMDSIDGRVLEGLVARCSDPAIRAEVERAPSDAARTAILEDSLHHDAPAWPMDLRRTKLRAPHAPSRVRLTLPLSAALYRSARAADTPWTRPNRTARKA
jgi:murein DD-endopeptidase MepM/ murein hydrolase activator NlpD